MNLPLICALPPGATSNKGQYLTPPYSPVRPARLADPAHDLAEVPPALASDGVARPSVSASNRRHFGCLGMMAGFGFRDPFL
jgi:hypothetical protein